MNLRPYQTEIVNGVKDAIKQGKRKPIAVAPTGAGKTVMFASIANDTHKKGNSILIIVHRTELVDQTCSKLDAFGLQGKYQKLEAGFKTVKAVPIFVAMSQTLRRRDTLPPHTVLIIDECHDATHDKILECSTATIKLGFTATPTRQNGKKLYNLYDDIVSPVQTPDLIELGYLCGATYYGVQEDIEVKKKGKDYDPADNIRAVKLRGNPVKLYNEHAHDSRCMVFCVNVAHAEHVAMMFKTEGVPTTLVHSNMTKKERNNNIANFKKGIYSVVVNCGILTTGFDDPTVQTVLMARCTTSLPLWLQCVGRGSRPSVNKQGTPDGIKSTFTVIDMGSNIQRHGFWHQARKWELKPPKKKKEGLAPVKECPKCMRIVYASARKCECGYTFKEDELPKTEDGALELVLPIGLESYDKITKLETAKKENKYKHGWLIHSLHSQGLLDDYLTLKGYASGYRNTIAKIYNI